MTDAPKVDPVAVRSEALGYVRAEIDRRAVPNGRSGLMSFSTDELQKIALALSQSAPKQPRDAAAVRAEALEEAAEIAEVNANWLDVKAMVSKDEQTRIRLRQGERVAAQIAIGIRALAAQTGGV